MPGSAFERPTDAAQEAAATATDAPVLVFDQMSFSYSKLPFIVELSCSMAASRITGIVGPNGCGKSTLLKLASGLLAPQDGTIGVRGRKLSSLNHAERARQVALMPQNVPDVYMSVRELVLSGRYSHQGLLQIPDAEDYRMADEALSAVGIDALALRSVHELSGGQRQRAYVAMMLAQEAPLMLLDEPTSALDIHAAHDVLQLIRSLRETRDATIVLVMHDLDLALRYCDTLMVMDAGSIVAQGTAEEMASSGVLERVFHIDIHHHRTPAGDSWSFFPARKPL